MVEPDRAPTDAPAPAPVPTVVPSRSLLFDVPRALLRHSLSFLSMGDLFGANAASWGFARELDAHLAAATVIHSGVSGPGDQSPAGVGARVLAKLERHARSLVSLHIDDTVRWSIASRVYIEPIIRRCWVTLAVARFPPNFYTLEVQRALSTCPRLREVRLSPFYVHEIHAMTDIVVALASGCPEIDTVVLQGRHSHAERFARIPLVLLTRLPSERVTTISLNTLCEGHSPLLARFTNTTGLTIEHLYNRSGPDMEAFQDAILRMTSLAKLAMGIFEYGGFADPARPLLLPPSLTALDLAHIGSETDALSVRLDAPNLLDFTSRRYSETGLARVVRGAPRLRSIRCTDIRSADCDWLELLDAMHSRSLAAPTDQATPLRVFSIDRCIAPTGASLLRIAHTNPGLETLAVRTRIFSADQLVAIICCCPNLAVLDLPLFEDMPPSDLRLVIAEVRPPGGDFLAHSSIRLPVVSESKLRQLHLGTCSLTFLRLIAEFGLTLHVARVAVDEFQTSYSMDTRDPVDPFAVLEAFPAAESCDLRLGYSPTYPAWCKPTRPSRVARLGLTVARGDFGDLVPALAAWCPLLRELTLVGPDLEPGVLDRIAAEPGCFTRLAVLRFCGRGKYAADDPFAALRAARPHLVLSRCIHGYESDSDGRVCKWW